MMYKKTAVVLSLITAIVIMMLNVTSCKNSVEKTNDEDSSNNNSKDSFKVRALTDVVFEKTPERLAKGKYLAEGILQCLTCHSPHNWDSAGAPPIAGREGSGGEGLLEDSTTKVIPPNITPDKETGGGTWTDDMFARAIREGIGHDGRVLSWRMPSQNFRFLSDEDLAAVIVYLRSLHPVHNKVEVTKLPAAEIAWIQKASLPLTEKVVILDLSDSIKRGKYLVRIADCMGCHSYAGEYSPGIFGGGNNVHMFGRTAISANITTDSTGIGYGVQGFLFVMHTGKGNKLSPIMPWSAFKNLNDIDLKAIYAYLSTIPVAQHHVSNQLPFTRCILCRKEHPNGDKNVIPKPAGINVSDDVLEKYAGTYFNEKYNATYIITKQGRKLVGQQAENAPKIELVPQTQTYFLAPGWVVPLTFITDSKGHAIAVKEGTDYGEAFKKIK